MATNEEKREGVKKWAIATSWSSSQFQLSIKTPNKVLAVTRSETLLAHLIIWDLKISQRAKHYGTVINYLACCWVVLCLPRADTDQQPLISSHGSQGSLRLLKYPAIRSKKSSMNICRVSFRKKITCL